MKKSSLYKPTRRDFLCRIMPACTVSCLVPVRFSGFLKTSGRMNEQQSIHKFDKEYRKLSLRQYRELEYKEYINIIRTLSKEFGKEKVLDLIKKETHNRMLQYGKSQMGINLVTYKKNFEGPGFERSLTAEIIEDTGTVFEMKVTECIFAAAFLKHRAGDIGYATVCHGDFAWAEGYHPKIKLTRDKTLMEGHDCCNHRYTWEG